MTEEEYLVLKLFGLTEIGQKPTFDLSNIEDLTKFLTIINQFGSLQDFCRLIVALDMYKNTYTTDPVFLSDMYDASLRSKAEEYLLSIGITMDDIVITDYRTSMNNCSEDYAVVFPARRSIIPIRQQFWDKKIRFYLVKGAETWSGKKNFNNRITYAGEYANRSNFMYLIDKNKYARGLDAYTCTKRVDWRCKLYAPIFAGNDSANTNARETDVLLILAEWLDASEQGVRAADHYIRDLYALINYSKGVDYGDGKIVEPTLNERGSPYIHPGSYTYMYIPDEILLFDDTTSEKAFWLDRLICTPEDPINQETENYLRSQAPTFTWQVVDYQLYEECQNSDGTARAYALWMFGDSMSRLMYAISANASMQENEKVFDGNWGGYAPGMHAASDLFGRNTANKVYREVFPGGKKSKSAAISAEYDPITGKVELNNGGTAGVGLFINQQPVTLKLGDKNYSFSGSAAAAWGYQLYRQTMILKDGEKAEKQLREALEQEIEWPELRAIAPGIVTDVIVGSGSGFKVVITHAIDPARPEKTNALYTQYYHMKRYPLVQVGQYVGAGTLLGYEGTTGYSGTTHVHLDLDYFGSQPNPVHYMYPFFTPFYYEEKAAESNYVLDSEYLSTARTVFPYRQINNGKKGKEPDEAKTPPLETDSEGYIKIKNYVPAKSILDNSELFLNEDSGFEGYVDYSQLPTKNLSTTLEGSKYEGEILKTNPNYFSENFIRKVQMNNHKISGIELDWNEKTEYIEPITESGISVYHQNVIGLGQNTMVISKDGTAQ